ncbi:hypothetical protein CERZMDRAFT_110945 [Cercospora zeae-maydis SCOH1-5]|uniref:Aquaporin-like protein n=1 Tax=Cercospora zeae-maydis SCOH1-5 TaxID=717836 RepID=A0A6A6FKR2_9PEZI|nr:hypothetical protein CERZMDRAFT_110945 [Cercospora zeae-maydis SCOH1-5]
MEGHDGHDNGRTRSRRETSAGLRRRGTVETRKSGTQGKASTAGGRTRGLSLAGPQEVPVIQQAYEPYVHPGYTELNPAYEQPANAKPVWSLAKPLPRVLRPGMIPTKSEIMQSRQNPELPAEQTQKANIDVDPNDLEAGRIDFDLNPKKVSAQLIDSRAQRENNLISHLAGQGTVSPRLEGRPARASSTASRMRRARASSAASQRSTVGEHAPHEEDRKAQEPAPLSPAEDRQSEPKLGRIPENDLPLVPETEQDDKDDASLSTLSTKDDDGVWQDMDPIKLVENHEGVEEVHNNHTWWSVVRTQYRELLAELLGTFVQLTIGFCGDIQVTLNHGSNSHTTAWLWGMATMMAIYIAGGISGAHFNPSITTILWFYRGFPKRKMLEYFIAQFLGAFLACYAAYGIYYAGIQEYLQTGLESDVVNGFVTSQRHDFIGVATAFFNEFLGTAFLACTVLALGDDQNAPPGAGMNAFIIGLVITGLNLSFVYNTGLAMNFTRDFAPRLALLSLGYGAKLFTNPYWVYGPGVATICGAMTGAALYDIAIFTGGESPINYPWTRTKRSWRKGKAKWKRRARLQRKGEGEEKWAR